MQKTQEGGGRISTNAKGELQIWIDWLRAVLKENVLWLKKNRETLDSKCLSRGGLEIGGKRMGFVPTFRSCHLKSVLRSIDDFGDDIDRIEAFLQHCLGDA